MFGRPICCTLQGEDLFIEGLPEPYRSEALDLIRRQVNHVDLFISVSDFYADPMSRYFAIPRERIAVVPLGINVSGYDEVAKAQNHVFTIGYFARVAPEKGLHELCEAYRILRQERGVPAARLLAAGYLAPDHRRYLERLERLMRSHGLGDEFEYRGVLDRQEKIGFLKELDVLSVPGPFPDPKGMYLLEAMAAGTPVVQPKRGAYPEVISRAGGGLLVDEGPAALADGLLRLYHDRELAARLGAQGAAGVRARYGVAQSAARLVDVYSRLLTPVTPAPTPDLTRVS
jgi:glycosyltransferase involved in cell wall biosynthesis